MMTWTGVANENFAFTQGTPTYHTSSTGVERGHCAVCGTSVIFVGDKFPGEVHLTIGSFDDPRGLIPKKHVHTSEQLSWMDVPA